MLFPVNLYLLYFVNVSVSCYQNVYPILDGFFAFHSSLPSRALGPMWENCDVKLRNAVNSEKIIGPELIVHTL